MRAPRGAFWSGRKSDVSGRYVTAPVRLVGGSSSWECQMPAIRNISLLLHPLVTSLTKTLSEARIASSHNRKPPLHFTQSRNLPECLAERRYQSLVCLVSELVTISTKLAATPRSLRSSSSVSKVPLWRQWDINGTIDDAARLSSKARDELPGREKEAKTEAKVLGEQAGAKFDNAVCPHSETEKDLPLTRLQGCERPIQRRRPRKASQQVRVRRLEELREPQEGSWQGAQLCD